MVKKKTDPNRMTDTDLRWITIKPYKGDNGIQFEKIT